MMSRSPERISSYRRHFEDASSSSYQVRVSSPSPVRRDLARCRSASFTRSATALGSNRAMGRRTISSSRSQSFKREVGMGALCLVGGGPMADLDQAAEDNKEFLSTRTSERKEMVFLNDRLAVYIEKVRSLEQQNKLLETEIEALQNRFVKPSGLRLLYEEQLKELYKLAEKMRVQRSIAIGAKDAMAGQLEMIKVKYEEALEMRRKAEFDIEAFRPDVDAATSTRIALEKQLENLEVQLEFIQRVHKQEIEELMKQIYSAHATAMDAYSLPDLSGAMKQIQHQYDEIAAKNLQEMDSWYKTKFDDLNNKSSKHVDHVRSVREGIITAKKDIQNKQRDMDSLKTKNDALEAQIHEMQEKYRKELEELQGRIEALKLELKSSKQRTALLLREYQDLLNVKMALEIEITTYRKLIEGEDSRLTSMMQSMQTMSLTSSSSLHATGVTERGGRDLVAGIGGSSVTDFERKSVGGLGTGLEVGVSRPHAGDLGDPRIGLERGADSTIYGRHGSSGTGLEGVIGRDGGIGVSGAGIEGDFIRDRGFDASGTNLERGVGKDQGFRGSGTQLEGGFDRDGGFADSVTGLDGSGVRDGGFGGSGTGVGGGFGRHSDLRGSATGLDGGVGRDGVLGGSGTGLGGGFGRDSGLGGSATGLDGGVGRDGGFGGSGTGLDGSVGTGESFGGSSPSIERDVGKDKGFRGSDTNLKGGLGRDGAFADSGTGLDGGFGYSSTDFDGGVSRDGDFGGSGTGLDGGVGSDGGFSGLDTGLEGDSGRGFGGSGTHRNYTGLEGDIDRDRRFDGSGTCLEGGVGRDEGFSSSGTSLERDVDRDRVSGTGLQEGVGRDGGFGGSGTTFKGDVDGGPPQGFSATRTDLGEAVGSVLSGGLVDPRSGLGREVSKDHFENLDGHVTGLGGSVSCLSGKQSEERIVGDLSKALGGRVGGLSITDLGEGLESIPSKELRGSLGGTSVITLEGSLGSDPIKGLLGVTPATDLVGSLGGDPATRHGGNLVDDPASGLAGVMGGDPTKGVRGSPEVGFVTGLIRGVGDGPGTRVSSGGVGSSTGFEGLRGDPDKGVGGSIVFTTVTDLGGREDSDSTTSVTGISSASASKGFAGCFGPGSGADLMNGISGGVSNQGTTVYFSDEPAVEVTERKTVLIRTIRTEENIMESNMQEKSYSIYGAAGAKD